MIQIHIHIGKVSQDNQFVHLPYQGMILESIVDKLNIKQDDIGLIVVNGMPKRLSDHVDDSSVVYILPSLEGG